MTVIYYITLLLTVQIGVNYAGKIISNQNGRTIMYALLMVREFDNTIETIHQIEHYMEEYRRTPRKKYHPYITYLARNTYYGIRRSREESEWLDKYNDILFYRFFRMKKNTFQRLVNVLLENDIHKLLTKKYRGGNCPIKPETGLLIFLWFMSQQDTLQSTGHTFKVTASTVMQIVNVSLYIVVHIKTKYIFWPKTLEEFQLIINEFQYYPGAIGAIDCSHIDLKVPKAQHDSYVDRFQHHSINLLGICTARKCFTYVFCGFPGSAHDSRVLSHSGLVRKLEQRGVNYYFPNPEWHLIGDAGFPIKPWLMTPYRNNANLGRQEKHHNYCLSRARVSIENVFGIVKGRWRRLIFINTYSIAKGVEIATAACVLHNFCYQNDDEWSGEIYHENRHQNNYPDDNGQDVRLARLKRDNIARTLFRYRD